MFGRDKDQPEEEDNTVPVAIVPPAPTSEPSDELNLPDPQPEDNTSASDNTTAPVVDSAAPMENSLAPEPAVDALEPENPPTPTAADINITSGGTISSNTPADLSSLKQDALHELSPLIGHLDQSPDEKYATAKMVYEETNDQKLLSAVYEAAKNLTDEKAKAEAIYDVVKKINELH